MIEKIENILSFIHLTEKMKVELRNGEKSNGVKETIADHSFRVALMVVLLAPLLDKKIDVQKAMKIALVHDLAEIETGDEPYFICENNPSKKKEKNELESIAMKKICGNLHEPLKSEMLNLWEEYAYGSSDEAVFIKTLDKIEAQIQHNEADISIWNEFDFKYAFTRLDPYCEYDSMLTKMKDLVQNESKNKLIKHKINLS